MFGKKKNEGADAAPMTEVTESVAKAKPAAKAGKKATKKKSGMAQVLRESVLETVLDDFRNNDKFIQRFDGAPHYVGLFLKAADIGGLDKKSRKDEVKGSIVECINAGRIKVYVSDDLLEEDALVIIPDVVTLAAMEEFGILTDAPYEYCYVDENGDIDLTGTSVDYYSVCELAASDDMTVSSVLPLDNAEEDVDENVDDFLKDALENTAAAMTEDLHTEELGESVAAMMEDDIPSEDAMEDEIPVDDDVEGFDDLDEIPDVDGNGPATASAVPNMDMGYDPVQAAMQEAPAEQVENEVPGNWTDEALSRKFYSDDLGLEITTEPFDVQFLQGSVFVPFDEHRPDGWLNNHLNEMSRAANVEMAHLHENNLFLMRNRYFRLISMQCERIAKDLDIYDTTTQYGRMKMQMDEDRRHALDTVDEQVHRRKDEIEQAWRQKLQEVGMDAAREAQRRYKERYGKIHEADIYNIEGVVKSCIEAEYQDELRELNDRRRTEASSLLDLSIAEVMDEIGDMYVGALEDERVRYQELQNDIAVYLEDNRQADIARVKVLEDDLRQTDRADKILAEQTAKIHAMTEEYTAKRKDLQADVERIRKENDVRIAEMKRDNEDKLARVENEKAQLQQQIASLLDDYKELDAKKAQEYESRLSEMRSEIANWEDKCEHVISVHKRSNLMSVFFIVAAVIAALTIGFIGGEYTNTNRMVKQNQSLLMQQSDAVSDDAVDADAD